MGAIFIYLLIDLSYTLSFNVGLSHILQGLFVSLFMLRFFVKNCLVHLVGGWGN